MGGIYKRKKRNPLCRPSKNGVPSTTFGILNLSPIYKPFGFYSFLGGYVVDINNKHFLNSEIETVCGDVYGKARAFNHVITKGGISGYRAGICGLKCQRRSTH